VVATREIDGVVTKAVRYYLSSLAVCALTLAKAVRGHWSIENSCHWALDVVFREDDSRVSTGHAAENLGLAQRLANSLLQRAAAFATKPIGYKKPLRMQRVLGVVSFARTASSGVNPARNICSALLYYRQLNHKNGESSATLPATHPRLRFQRPFVLL